MECLTVQMKAIKDNALVFPLPCPWLDLLFCGHISFLNLMIMNKIMCAFDDLFIYWCIAVRRELHNPCKSCFCFFQIIWGPNLVGWLTWRLLFQWLKYILHLSLPWGQLLCATDFYTSISGTHISSAAQDTRQHT